MPNEVGTLIVAVVVAVVIVLVARRWRGDRPGNRGPYSTGTEVRGDFAAFGKTLGDRPPAEADDADPERTQR